MQRALGKKCVSKYKRLEYFWKSGNSGLLFATDAHICLAKVDNELAPGYYDSTYHPVKEGDWIACDVDAMFKQTTTGQKRCTITQVPYYYIADDEWVFSAERVDLLKEWTGCKELYLTDCNCLFGKSADGQRMGIVAHEDKHVYKVGPSVFLTEQEARNFAAMIGVNYV